MSRRLDGRVAIVTGAGRGLGRSHALELAANGAAVVVNDLGTATDGSGSDVAPAAAVAAEIRSMGGFAIESAHDIADWGQAEALISLAVEQLGRLDVLVNNAGILRDRSFANMSELEWDAVLHIHAKGHAATSHHAFAHWRARHGRGEREQASIINTTSIAGLFPNFGQANYVAAKAAIAALTQTLALEGARYGIRANAISPSARTRLVEGSAINVDSDGGKFDELAPENVSPLVAWLATGDCPATGQIFQIFGRRIAVCRLATFEAILASNARWTLDALDVQLPQHLMTMTTAEDAINALIRGGAQAD